MVHLLAANENGVVVAGSRSAPVPELAVRREDVEADGLARDASLAHPGAVGQAGRLQLLHRCGRHGGAVTAIAHLAT